MKNNIIVILDDNPMSLMRYAEEYPENWKAMVDGEETSEFIPQCPNCKKPMKNAIDSKTKKISKYLWKCDCKEMKGKVLSRG